MWGGIHSVPQPGGAPPSPDTVLEFQASFGCCCCCCSAWLFACLPTALHLFLPPDCHAAAWDSPWRHRIPAACRTCCAPCRSATRRAGWRTFRVRGRVAADFGGIACWLWWLWRGCAAVLCLGSQSTAAGQPCRHSSVENSLACPPSTSTHAPTQSASTLPSPPLPQCTSASSACCTWPTSTAWSSGLCRGSTACSSQTCHRASSDERAAAGAAPPVAAATCGSGGGSNAAVELARAAVVSFVGSAAWRLEQASWASCCLPRSRAICL